MLAYLDSECSVGAVTLSQALLSGAMASPSEAAVAAADDIDLDAIDAAMMGDEVDGAAENIDMEEMKDALSEDGGDANKPKIKPQSTDQEPKAA